MNEEVFQYLGDGLTATIRSDNRLVLSQERLYASKDQSVWMDPPVLRELLDFLDEEGMLPPPYSQWVEQEAD